ncbi:MAG: hypothetical protein JNJ46_33255 [Myxococcales bacterium]|nr:hypothetical protein [Myxococcales bacterium]
MTFRDFLADLVAGQPVYRSARKLLSLLTPPSLQGERPLTRALVVGGVIGSFGLTLVATASSALLLALSLAVLYYLITQVVGIHVDFDAQSLFGGALRDQSAQSAPN